MLIFIGVLSTCYVKVVKMFDSKERGLKEPLLLETALGTVPEAPDKPVDEKKHPGIFFPPPPALTKHQERIRSYMNSGSCGYHQDLGELVDKGLFVIDQPTLVFRSDLRSPFFSEGDIFSQGFDVYSLSRLPILNVPRRWLSHFAPLSREESISSTGSNLLFNALWMLMCPVSFITFGLHALYKDPCCGRARYDSSFFSNWSALAFSKEHKGASTEWSPNVNKEWIYAVYLEKSIDFENFSKQGIQKNCTDPFEENNQFEVFPVDLHNQRVGGNHIIGAYAHGLRGHTFYFNPQFSGWDLLKEKLQDRGWIVKDGENPSIKKSPDLLNKFLEEILLSSTLESLDKPTRQSMT